MKYRRKWGINKETAVPDRGENDEILTESMGEEDADGKIFPGAGHGLHGQDAETATEYMLEYLQAHAR